MSKNSAIRVSDILTKIWENSAVRIEDGWKKALNVDTLVEVFVGIEKVDRQLTIIEKQYRDKNRGMGKLDKNIQEIRNFLNLPNLESPVHAYTKTYFKEANIVAIGVAEAIFDDIDGENTIEQEKLDKMASMVDELFKEIENLEIDKKTKKLFLNVLHEMKMSFKFYEIDGVATIEDAWINLICRTKQLESNIATDDFTNKAKKLIVFVGENIASTYIGSGINLLNESVKKVIESM